MAAKRKSNGGRRGAKESPTGDELLVNELQQIHNAENQLSRVMTRISKAVESETLREMLDERLTQGEEIIKGIETVFDELEVSPGRKKNVAAEGLINDAREHVEEIEVGPALDAVLVGSLQKTEHYCIAAWGTARALANATGQKSAVRVMERALKEGGTFDERLTQLAQTEITPALLNEADEEAQPEIGSEGSRKRSLGAEKRTHA